MPPIEFGTAAGAAGRFDLDVHGGSPCFREGERERKGVAGLERTGQAHQHYVEAAGLEGHGGVRRQVDAVDWTHLHHAVLFLGGV